MVFTPKLMILAIMCLRKIYKSLGLGLSGAMNASNDPPPKGKRRLPRIKGWQLSLALIGACFLPCPDCSLPIAVHAWPLLLLILAKQLVKRRGQVLLRDSQEGRENVTRKEMEKTGQHNVCEETNGI